jgi:hypothetical protein
MSKCDVTIELERPEREFVGDEAIEGVIVVRANEDVMAERVTLSCFWETHGRGNRDSGFHHSEVLDQDVQLRAGEQRSFPFRVTTPHGPPTYHGTHLNVDHYVEAEVDLAWAKNPKGRADFLLRAGPEYEGPPSPVTPAMGLASEGKAPPGVKVWKGPVANMLGCLVLAILLGFILIFFFAFWPLAIIGGLVGVFFYVRRRMVRSRVGDVTFSVGPTRLAAGDACTIRLAFSPEKSSQVNKLTVTLIAQEICTSGSGTNKTTRTFEVVSEEHELRGAGALRAKEQIDIERVVIVPERGAYSFEASNNKLRWIAEARIDIPGWPDWSRKEPLVVLPPIAGASSREVETSAPVESVPDLAASPRTPIPQESRERQITASDLDELLAGIQATDRYSEQRDRLLAAVVGLRVTFDVQVQTTEWTSSFDNDVYRDGRSIAGTLAGTSIPVRVRFEKALNSSVDAVASGDRIRVYAALAGWDRLLDRADFDVLTLEGRVGG